MSEQPTEPSDPPPRSFQLKPPEFERANRAPGDDDSKPIDVRTLNLQAQQTNLAFGAKPAEPAENEIHAILQDNLARANEAGANDLVLTDRKMSRRTRDFWIVLAGGYLVMLVLAFLFTRSQTALFIATAGGVIYAVALVWVMWFVMDDY